MLWIRPARMVICGKGCGVERIALRDVRHEPAEGGGPPDFEMKIRLDKLVLERGLAPTRERAQALVLAGRVLVNEQKVDKPGTGVPQDASLRLLGDDLRYVGRGGLKLERALEHWKIELAERTCVDVGASTGGFTDCMLQHGAKRVIAIDTGYGQIAAQLRDDPRVRLLEKTNARYLKPQDVGEAADFVAMDVSFISATLVLPAVTESVQQAANSNQLEAVVLVKPQFEVGRELVGKGGIVRDEQAQQAAVDKVATAMEGLGFEQLESIESPILGTEGNREFLIHGKKQLND
jgi:23S rRNA (cytidine1920-2'-O)/16S rRNA (cytidine1409-2'-O)-methyltransferase